MKKILTLLAAATLLLLPSCRFIRVSDDLKEQMKNRPVNVNIDGNGERIEASDNIATRCESTGDFQTLLCNLPCDMTYTPGDCALTLSGPDNVLEHISVTNEDGTLNIKSDGANFRNLRNLRVTLSSPVLESATFNGAVDFQAPQGITGTEFRMTVNGAGDIDITSIKADNIALFVNGAGDATLRGIDCRSLQIEINGAGDATVSGKADSAELTISGAGDIDARSLQTTGELTTKVRGIGKIQKPNN